MKAKKLAFSRFLNAEEERAEREKTVRWTVLATSRDAGLFPRTRNEKSQANAWLFECRGGGIRTPGTSRFNGFQDRRDRPLCHSSMKLSRFQDRRPDDYREALCHSSM